MTTNPTLMITPLESVGPVRLGMSRDEVRMALAPFTTAELDQTETLDYAFGNSLQIKYSDDGLVQFVGVGWYDECRCDYTLTGVQVGDLSALDMFATLAKLDGSRGLTYSPDSLLFPRILVNEG